MKNAFTLVETVIVIGISSIALGALVNLFFIFNSIYGYQQAFLAAAGSSGKSMKALEAATFPADAVLASHTFSGTTYSSATSTLVLELPSVDSSGAVITGSSDYIVFYSSGTTLYRKTAIAAGSVRTAGTTILSTTLQSVSFTYDNATFASVKNVTADIQTQAQYKQQVVQSHLNEQLRLRNAP